MILRGRASHHRKIRSNHRESLGISATSCPIPAESGGGDTLGVSHSVSVCWFASWPEKETEVGNKRRGFRRRQRPTWRYSRGCGWPRGFWFPLLIMVPSTSVSLSISVRSRRPLAPCENAAGNSVQHPPIRVKPPPRLTELRSKALTGLGEGVARPRLPEFQKSEVKDFDLRDTP